MNLSIDCIKAGALVSSNPLSHGRCVFRETFLEDQTFANEFEQIRAIFSKFDEIWTRLNMFERWFLPILT